MSGKGWTQGEKRTCETCRYWSEMRAEARLGVISAVCLNTDSPSHMRFTSERYCCSKWASGHLGAVDDPDVLAGGVDPYVGET